jgi:poly(hydroxyalkanoate) depolymerase family esterase
MSFNDVGNGLPTYVGRHSHAAMFAIALAACSNGGPNPVDDIGDIPGPGTYTKYEYAVDPYPHRDYYVYVPSTLPPTPAPLIVYLHGCQQTANDAALGVRWNEAAEAHGFIVVYPEQKVSSAEQEDPTDGNGGHCWNWFLPDHQQRDAGEPATIAGITQRVMSEYNVDADRVYVIGASAGAGMSANLAASYPDLYAAVGLVAGVPYTGGDLDGSQAAAAMGEHARVMPVFVAHGTLDEVAVFPAGVAEVHQWLGTNDIVDDGSANNSVSRQPDSIENFGVDASLLANLGTIGDLCITPPMAVPCVGGALGLNEYPHTVAHYVDAQGQPLIDFWIVHGAGHAYVGGSREGNYTDPIGPNTTALAYAFFMAHPMVRP